MSKKEKVAEPTAAEKAEAKAAHEKLCHSIRLEQAKTRQFVQQKFRGNCEPLWLDNKRGG